MPGAGNPQAFNRYAYGVNNPINIPIQPGIMESVKELLLPLMMDCAGGEMIMVYLWHPLFLPIQLRLGA